jgi:predicted ATPase
MPTITMFAGPNGSGKSTIKQAFDTSEYSINYINADEIEQSLNLYGFIDLSKYSISISQIDFIEYLKKTVGRMLQ